MELTDSLKRTLSKMYGTEPDSPYFKEMTACLKDFKDPVVHFMGVGIYKYSMIITLTGEADNKAFARKLLSFTTDTISRINDPGFGDSKRFSEIHRTLNDVIEGGSICSAKKAMLPLLNLIRVVEVISEDVPPIMKFVKFAQFVIIDLMEEDEYRMYKRSDRSAIVPNVFATFLVSGIEALIAGDLSRTSDVEAQHILKNLEAKLKLTTRACEDIEMLLEANGLILPQSSQGN